jgi:hypothetical protein
VTPEVVGLLSILLGGGFVAGIAAWRTSGSEATTQATSSLIAVNEELRTELARRDREHREEIELRNGEIAKLRERVAVLEKRL